MVDGELQSKQLVAEQAAAAVADMLIRTMAQQGIRDKATMAVLASGKDMEQPEGVAAADLLAPVQEVTETKAAQAALVLIY